jgi:hypothetical protein
MDFIIGEKVKYYFPNPKNSAKKFFIGFIENISENHIVMRNDENITLKVSFANYDLLKRFTSSDEGMVMVSENYFG